MAPSSLDAAIVDSTSQRLAAVDLLEQNNTRKKKEKMDAEQVMDVPDTPDRLASQKINVSLENVQNRELLKGIKGSHRLSACQHNSKRFYSNSVNASGIMDEIKPSNSDVSKSDHDQLGTVGLGDRISKRLESKPSAKTLPVESSSAGRSPNITESLSVPDRSQDKFRGSVIDLQQKVPFNNLRYTKNNSGRNIFLGSGNSSSCKDLSMDVFNCKNVYENSEKYERASHIGTSKNHAYGEIRMGSTFDGTHKEAHGKTRAADSIFLSPDIAMSSQICSNTLKGENQGGAGTNGNHVDLTRGHGKWVDSLPANERNGSMLQSVNSPRKGQRRLVRNGCISPYNVAKSLGSSEKKGKDVTDDKQVGKEKMTCSNLSEGITPSFEGSPINRVKGKGIISSTVPANEYNGRSSSTSSSSRHLLVLDEEDNFKSAEDKNGWRSTHSRSKKTCLHPSQETKSSTKRRNGFVWNLGEAENADPVKDLNTDIDLLEVKDPVSLQPTGSVQHQASSSSTSGYMLEKERHRGVQKLIKRRRKSTLSRNRVGECSSLVSDDSDVSFICPSGKSNLGVNKSPRSLRIGRLGPVIEVDELCSPEITSSNSSQEACIISEDSNIKDRQVEADEKLARQLQEQFYNELPGVGQSDASIALTLQHEEDAHATFVGNHHRHPRDSSMAHLYRNRLQSFQNSSVGLASHGQVPRRARMTQLRRRLNITSASASSSGGRSFQFPSNMNLETRLRLLEALEAADNTMAMTNQFLQVQRDFNENDYEMLLALDDDNHQHAGASINQINSLPESKVQTDNFEEECTICLETPSTGDTIRHLPCLHKFHKECIDPWLRRRKSCPICKSDIT